MGRYEGAVCRHCRREGVKLFLKGEKCFTKCTLDRRAMPPGMHTQVRRRKVSDYGIQLRAKQRARRTYFLPEKHPEHSPEPEVAPTRPLLGTALDALARHHPPSDLALPPCGPPAPADA